MNLVWPITALYSGPLGLYVYFKIGRLSTLQALQEAKSLQEMPPNMKKPFWQKTMVGATHCGSGCTLGDILAEWILFYSPLVIFGKPIFGGWILDYVFAFIFGIAFQYFTIKPMKGLSAKDGIIQALKADFFSLSAWQIGMYGWMAIAVFAIFDFEIPKTSPVFWFLMQIAMLFGFLTSYPVNWWLIKKKIKESM